ncbi:HD domain-containing protein [Lachnospiraceae bacterium]|nr:HD domain-containing protein [Lachnospiraceae bacterium]
MIYTHFTKLAMKVAYKAHEGQTDRNGLPYIYHPLHLAEQMETEDTCVVALLHDVVEDTDMTIEDLRVLGFTEKQLEAVEYMTHISPEGELTEEEKLEDYYSYVRRIKENEIATKVKLADLAHNSDLTRLDKVTDADLKRLEKYQKAVDILKR